ncbi:DUF1127 domain-containing protein [Roseibium sp.]|uniref:DUF1127 domain-containing protein n=1 Tax=Roseibium sp. TaxID=1936156 RepID=UPI003D0E1E6A
MSLEIETVFRNRAHSRGLLLDAIRAVAEGLRRYYLRRATDRALSRLSERELKDIGLFRTEFGDLEIHKDSIRARERQ